MVRLEQNLTSSRNSYQELDFYLIDYITVHTCLKHIDQSKLVSNFFARRTSTSAAKNVFKGNARKQVLEFSYLFEK